MGIFRIRGYEKKIAKNPVFDRQRLDVTKKQIKLNEIKRLQNIKLIKDGKLETITKKLSASHSVQLKTMKWLEGIPEDAMLVGDKAEEFRTKFGSIVDSILKWKGIKDVKTDNVIEAGMLALIPDVGALIPTENVTKIPAKLISDIKMMLDPNKGIVVRNAYASMAGIYGYLGLSLIGGVAVAGVPDVPAVNAAINSLASLGLFLGIYSVRGRTTLEFQHLVLRALSRGPEYYTFKGFQKESIRAAGIDFDPNRIGAAGKPFEVAKDAAKCITVIYFRDEENVLERSLFGHLLLENKNRTVILGGDPPDSKYEKMYLGEIETVKVFAETIRDNARAAKKNMNSVSAAKACDDLIKVMKFTKEKYLAKGQEYWNIAGDKFDDREQGSAAALDEYTGVQFQLHADKWQQKIDALKKHLAALKAGNVTEDQMKAHIASYYEYMDHKFTFDIVFNQRLAKTVDLKLQKEISDSVKTKLVRAGVDFDKPATYSTIKLAGEAIREEYSGRRKIKKAASSLVESMATGKYNESANKYILEAIKTGKTVSEIVNEIVMLDLGRSQFRMGAKAGARSNFLDKLGRSMVMFEDNFGNPTIVSKADWEKYASGMLVAEMPMFEKIGTTLAKTLFGPKGEKAEEILTAEKADQIVEMLKSDITIKLGENKDKLRILERLSGSFIGTATAGDFLREALIVAMRKGKVEWQIFPDADFIGSYDKDYVPLSIDPYTGEYQDIFRMDIPMFKKWSKEEGRASISLIQNPQDQEHYMAEGPMRDGKRMMTENGQSLEPVAHVSKLDQDAWYGAFVLPKIITGLLNASVGKKTGEYFLSQLALRLYGKEFADKREEVFNKVKEDMERRNVDLSKTLDDTNGRNIIESMKRHAQDIMIATGIGPGRGYFNSMFSCGTVELEYVPGMKIGFHRPYVTDVDGRIMAQAEIRFNARSGKMEIYEYIPRFSNVGWFEGKNFPKQSEEKETKPIRVLSEHDKTKIKSNIKEKYGDKEVKIFNNKAIVIDKDSHKIERSIWWYTEPGAANDLDLSKCRRIELDFTASDNGNTSYGGESKVLRDYGPDGSYYETYLKPGQGKKEVVYGTEENFSQLLMDINLTREVVGEPTVEVSENGEAKITFRSRIPEIVTVFKSNEGKHSEEIAAQPVFQPDKWITEDMNTTYFQLLTGWQTEIHPGEAGSAVGPSDLTDLLIQHHRWFKGGPEGYLDISKYLNANQDLMYSAQGKYMKQAYLWPMHTAVDKLLYAIPAAYWVGQYVLPEGLSPLSTPALYLPMFGFYMYETLAMYSRVMGMMGAPFNDVVDKEAFLTLAHSVYNDADWQAINRMPLDFETTKAGDRKMAPYKYLHGMKTLKNFSYGTAIAGAAFTAGLFGALGMDVPAPGLTLASSAFNAGFPLIKGYLFSRGIDKLYGYWSKFDMLVKEKIESAGGGETLLPPPEIDGSRKLTFAAPNEATAKKAVKALKEFAKVEDNFKFNNGTATVNIKIKEGGMYERYDKGAWVDGKTNFKHDHDLLAIEDAMFKKLEKASKKTPEKALAIYKAIVAEKKRRSAVISNKIDDKYVSKKVTFEATNKEKALLSDSTMKLVEDLGVQMKDKNGKKMNLVQLAYEIKKGLNEKTSTSAKDRILMIADAMVETKNIAEASILLEKLAEVYKAKSEKIVQLAAKAVAVSPADAAEILASMKPEQLKAVLNSKDDAQVYELVTKGKMLSKLDPSKEYALVSSIAEIRPGIADILSKEVYGITNDVRKKLFDLAEELDMNVGDKSEQLEELAGIIKSIPTNKIDIAIVKLIGINHAETVFELLEKGVN